MKNKIYLSPDYYYNEISSTLYFKEKPVLLSKNEKKLFELLLKNKGNIVLSEVIENTIWPDYPIKDSTRRTLVYRLRKKLNNNIIEHVPRIGCRLLVQ